MVRSPTARVWDRPAQGPNGKYVGMLIEMFTLVRHRDRDQDPLFPTVPVPFPLAVPPPFSCGVNEPQRSLILHLDATHGA